MLERKDCCRDGCGAGACFNVIFIRCASSSALRLFVSSKALSDSSLFESSDGYAWPRASYTFGPIPWSLPQGSAQSGQKL